MCRLIEPQDRSDYDPSSRLVSTSMPSLRISLRRLLGLHMGPKKVPPSTRPNRMPWAYTTRPEITGTPPFRPVYYLFHFHLYTIYVSTQLKVTVTATFSWFRFWCEIRCRFWMHVRNFRCLYLHTRIKKHFISNLRRNSVYGIRKQLPASPFMLVHRCLAMLRHAPFDEVLPAVLYCCSFCRQYQNFCHRDCTGGCRTITCVHR
jgi:hypothetical protein